MKLTIDFDNAVMLGEKLLDLLKGVTGAVISEVKAEAAPETPPMEVPENTPTVSACVVNLDTFPRTVPADRALVKKRLDMLGVDYKSRAATTKLRETLFQALKDLPPLPPKTKDQKDREANFPFKTITRKTDDPNPVVTKDMEKVPAPVEPPKGPDPKDDKPEEKLGPDTDTDIDIFAEGNLAEPKTKLQEITKEFVRAALVAFIGEKGEEGQALAFQILKDEAGVDALKDVPQDKYPAIMARLEK